MMSGRARVLAAVRGEPVDRIPIAQHNYPFAAHRAGLSLQEFCSSPEKAAKALADAAYDFGYDCIIVAFDDCTLAEAMGAGVEFVEDQPPRISSPAVDSLAEVPFLSVPDPLTDGRLPLWLETTRRLRAIVGDELAILARADQGPFGLAFLLEDSEQFLMDLLTEDRRTVAAALSHCLEAGVAFAGAQLDAGADLTSIGESAAGGSVISPALYREFAQPFEKAFKSRLGSRPLSLHICGATDAIVGDMVETGCEVLELDHLNHLSATFEKVGRRACVWGNVDPSSVLMLGSPRFVLEQSRAAIQAAQRANARFVLCPGCTVGANTPPASIAAMTEAARLFG
jgi:uroporphyrinogen decarboxylase